MHSSNFRWFYLDGTISSEMIHLSENLRVLKSLDDDSIGLLPHKIVGDSRLFKWRFRESETEGWFYLESANRRSDKNYLRVQSGSNLALRIDRRQNHGDFLWKKVAVPDKNGWFYIQNKGLDTYLGFYPNSSSAYKLGLGMVITGAGFPVHWNIPEVEPLYTNDDLEVMTIDPEAVLQTAILPEWVKDVATGSVEISKAILDVGEAIGGLSEFDVAKKADGLANFGTLLKADIDTFKNVAKVVKTLKIGASVLAGIPVVLDVVGMIIGEQTEYEEIVSKLNDIDGKINDLPSKMNSLFDKYQRLDDLKEINAEIINLREGVISPYDKLRLYFNYLAGKNGKGEDLGAPLNQEGIINDAREDVLTIDMGDLDKALQNILDECSPVMAVKGFFWKLEEATYCDYRQINAAGTEINDCFDKAMKIYVTQKKLKGELQDNDIKQRAEDEVQGKWDKFKTEWDESFIRCLGQPRPEIVGDFLEHLVYSDCSSASGIVAKLKTKYPQSDWLAIVYPKTHRGYNAHAFHNEFIWHDDVLLADGKEHQVIIACKPAGKFSDLEGLCDINVPKFDLIVQQKKVPLNLPFPVSCIDYKSGKPYLSVLKLAKTKDESTVGSLIALKRKLGPNYLFFESDLLAIANSLQSQEPYSFKWLARSKELKDSSSHFSYGCSFPDRMEAVTNWDTSVIRFR